MGEGGLFIPKWERMPKVCCKSECQNCSELSPPPRQQRAFCAALWYLQSYSQIFLSKGCSHLLSCLFQKCSGAGWKQSPVVPGIVRTKPWRQLLPRRVYSTIVLLKCSFKTWCSSQGRQQDGKTLLPDPCQFDFGTSKYKWDYIFLYI